jgi:hypothetical protein
MMAVKKQFPHDEQDSESPARRDDPLPHIADALRGLRYGQLTILIQDGVVVQIERTEKRRLR